MRNVYRFGKAGPKKGRQRRRLRQLPPWLPLMGLVAVAAAALIFTDGIPQIGTLARSGPSTVIRSSPTKALTGRASVIDGDTIDIHGERIRFSGIDAPESRQTCQDSSGRDYRCGSISTNELDRFLGQSRPTRCEFVNRDRYGRFVGDCYRADGESVAAWLVSNGLALDWPRYSGGAYAGEERDAKARQIGIWQGKFEKPWKWRAKNR